MPASIFCSIIIPTIGRATLNRSISSVINQDFTQADYEIIVVNDSGVELAKAEWQKSPKVLIVNTNQLERSNSRNCGAAIARGEYLGFLDDDDWYLPGAFEIFWKLANQYPEAAWLYGGIQVVDEYENCLAEINSRLQGNSFAQVIGGAWVPLQSSLIKTRFFFQSGGFNHAICGTEDEDLCRKIAYYGDFANVTTTIACLYRGHSWSTSTNYLRATEDRRLSRNLVLSEKNSFKRLVNSTKTSYWFGRICKIYISLFFWNLRNKRIFTALSRGIYAVNGFIYSGIHIFTREFWRGVKANHVPESLHFVIDKYSRHRRVSNHTPTP